MWKFISPDSSKPALLSFSAPPSSYPTACFSNAHCFSEDDGNLLDNDKVIKKFK